MGYVLTLISTSRYINYITTFFHVTYIVINLHAIAQRRCLRRWVPPLAINILFFIIYDPSDNWLSRKGNSYLPSTINISHSSLFLELQSASFPGRTVREVLAVLRTASFAFLAFSLAFLANSALLMIAFASFS